MYDTSISQFLSFAAAEKLAALDTEDYFRSRVARADRHRLTTSCHVQVVSHRLKGMNFSRGILCIKYGTLWHVSKTFKHQTASA